MAGGFGLVVSILHLTTIPTLSRHNNIDQQGAVMQRFFLVNSQLFLEFP